MQEVRDPDPEWFEQLPLKPIALAARPAAVALVNRGDDARDVAVELTRLNLDPGARAAVRDAWTGRELPVEGRRIAVRLAPRETALLVVQGSPRLAAGAYVSEMPARVRVLADGADALPAALRASWVPVQADAAPSGEALVIGGRRIDDGIGALVNSRLAVRLDGEFGRFRARAGVMESAALGSAPHGVTWRVYGDGKPLFERTGAGVDIDVAVHGVRRLELAAVAPAGTAGLIAWGGAELAREAP